MKFDFVASQHSGDMPGSAMQCHHVYRLANILVSVMSSGRSHVGSITFKFRDQHGQQCTAAAWLAEHPEPWLTMTTLSQPLECPITFHGAPDVHISTFQGPGIDIEMSTHGRSHRSSFAVSAATHVAQLRAHNLATCNECPTIDVLQAEQPTAAAAQAGLQATAVMPAGLSQFVAAV